MAPSPTPSLPLQANGLTPAPYSPHPIGPSLPVLWRERRSPRVLLVNNAGLNYGLYLGACEPHSEYTGVKNHLESMVSPSQRTEAQVWSELVGISNTDSGMIVE